MNDKNEVTAILVIATIVSHPSTAQTQDCLPDPIQEVQNESTPIENSNNPDPTPISNSNSNPNPPPPPPPPPTSTTNTRKTSAKKSQSRTSSRQLDRINPQRYYSDYNIANLGDSIGMFKYNELKITDTSSDYIASLRSDRTPSTLSFSSQVFTVEFDN
eukprot:TRINITY_DN914_c0_g1_i4.p1 TRINITY_DN914_c0_g1~~TRINITY_DN914_c0_g1_i4.p1  ORF type:complete len:159 (+),score=38.21 TRINITY_DN914_c0_g1_i4:222-698(+)